LKTVRVLAHRNSGDGTDDATNDIESNFTEIIQIFKLKFEIIFSQFDLVEI